MSYAPEVTVSHAIGEIVTSTPYHPGYPPSARKIGGDWIKEQKVWVFPLTSDKTEGVVRELCRQVYGTDGTHTFCNNVELNLDERFGIPSGDAGKHHKRMLDSPTLYAFGRQLFWLSRSFGPGVVRGPGVIVREGALLPAITARRYGEIEVAPSAPDVVGWRPGTIITVLDVPNTAPKSWFLVAGVTLTSTAEETAPQNEAQLAEEEDFAEQAALVRTARAKRVSPVIATLGGKVLSRRGAFIDDGRVPEDEIEDEDEPA